MPFWPTSLIREIAERRVLFFMGAGLSKTAHRELPSWSDLLKELSERLLVRKNRGLVIKLAKQGNMLDAAQILRDGVPRADMHQELRRIFQIRPIPHDEIYQDILLMDPKVLITTNYDELIEKNFEYYSGGTEAHSIIKLESGNIINDLRSPIRSIIKVHGCISNPSSLILERSSYFNARRDHPGLFSTIESLMTINTVLFLGYSISDPDIQLTLENINLYIKSDNPHYALMSKFENKSVRDAFTHSYNVFFLEYPQASHSQVKALIAELRQNVIDLRSSRGIS